jgi:hypothetical protein
MYFDQDLLNDVLNAVNVHLEQLNSPLIEIVVCGGSALQALGLINRMTRDLDILALASSNIDGPFHIKSAKYLPVQLLTAASIVERDFNLPKEWLNAGPTDLLSHGLPPGLIDRLLRIVIGSRLIVHDISRYDQICFKMYASINGGSERHLNDLYMLVPSEDELYTAAVWCLSQDASEVFPMLVKDFLKKGRVFECR